MGRRVLPITHFFLKRSNGFSAGLFVDGVFVDGVSAPGLFRNPGSFWNKLPTGFEFVPALFVDDPAPVTIPPTVSRMPPVRPPINPPAARARTPPSANL